MNQKSQGPHSTTLSCHGLHKTYFMTRFRNSLRSLRDRFGRTLVPFPHAALAATYHPLPEIHLRIMKFVSDHHVTTSAMRPALRVEAHIHQGRTSELTEPSRVPQAMAKITSWPRRDWLWFSYVLLVGNIYVLECICVFILWCVQQPRIVYIVDSILAMRIMNVDHKPYSVYITRSALFLYIEITLPIRSALTLCSANA